MDGFYDYEEIDQNEPISIIDKLKDKKILLIIGIIVIILIIIVISLLRSSKTEYYRLERELVNTARDYVRNNNIVVTKEIYLDVRKLNININDECLLTSGVIYDGYEYYPNLICLNYQSDIVENTSDNIELIGDEVVVLAKEMPYYEEGYNSNSDISIIGSVGSEEGVYNLVYADNQNNSIIRKVIVIDDNYILGLFPEITINGVIIENLKENEPYEEKGAIAKDNIDGDITNKLIIDNNININKSGKYHVIYKVVNSKGYKRTVVRNVNVGNDFDNVIYNLISNSDGTVTIVVSINDNNFDYIRLPNGDIKNEKYITYDVNKNGNYTFVVYGKDGIINEKLIEINNISQNMVDGNCKAILKSTKTEVTVNVNSANISSYEYIINNITEGISASEIFNSKTIKPASVSVKVKNSNGIVNKIDCSIEEKFVPQVITNSNGKNCLEGYTCYVQFDYQDSKYPYCSMNPEVKPESCGGIGRHGCSITSAAMAIANLGIKSPTGDLYNPFSVWDYLYPIHDKSIGYCWGGCSAWARIRDAINNAGLSAPHYESLNRANFQEIINHLKKGYPIILHAKNGPYAASAGHYMALLAIREEDNYVFLSDPSQKTGINKNKYNGRWYYSDTWIPLDDLVSGNVDNYLLVGPNGYF